MTLSKKTKSKEASIRKIERQITELRYDRRQLAELQDDYNKIVEQGFLDNQDRLAIQQNFDQMAGISKIINANYNATSAQVIENEQAREAGYVVLKTDVRVDVSAIDDVKIFNFLYLIDRYYPGLTNVQTFKLEKVKELSEASLRKMTREEPEPLVEGMIAFEWLSMVPKEDLRDEF